MHDASDRHSVVDRDTDARVGDVAGEVSDPDLGRLGLQRLLKSQHALDWAPDAEYAVHTAAPRLVHLDDVVAI